ncbi:unnamed protein product [Dicrocoelium dendriticum]|nr:unnamed protein product [Dicrocoelium dendriticum]
MWMTVSWLFFFYFLWSMFIFCVYEWNTVLYYVVVCFLFLCFVTELLFRLLYFGDCGFHCHAVCVLSMVCWKGYNGCCACKPQVLCNMVQWMCRHATRFV